MDSDTVDTTDRISDRFKRPGPRKQPMVDLKYITFGFSYLQVRFAVVKKIFDTFRKYLYCTSLLCETY